MPNWCYASVYIHASPESINKLWNEFEQALSANPMHADFGNKWLGNLLLHIGQYKEAKEEGAIRCRGNFVDRNKYPDRIECSIESAWNPHIYCIKAFVDNFVDDAVVTYQAEEPACELFWTNDPDRVGTAYVDCYLTEEQPRGLRKIQDFQDCPIDEIKTFLAEYLGHDGELQALVNEVNEQLAAVDEDSYLSVSPYEFVDITREEC